MIFPNTKDVLVDVAVIELFHSALCLWQLVQTQINTIPSVSTVHNLAQREAVPAALYNFLVRVLCGDDETDEGITLAKQVSIKKNIYLIAEFCP